MSDTIAVLEKLGIDPESPTAALSAMQTAQLMITMAQGREADAEAVAEMLAERDIDPHLELGDLPCDRFAEIYALAHHGHGGATTCVDFSAYGVGHTWPLGGAQFSVGAVDFDVDFDGGGGPDAARISEYPAWTPGPLLEPVGQPIAGLRIELPATSDVALHFIDAAGGAGPMPLTIEGFDATGSHVAVAHSSSYNTLETVRMAGVKSVVMTGVEILLKEVCYS